MRFPTPRTIKANLVWLWRWKITFYFAPPYCVYCKRPADVYFGRVWLCRRHPVMVPARAIGMRPLLFVRTRRASEKHMKEMFSSASPSGGLMSFLAQNRAGEDG